MKRTSTLCIQHMKMAQHFLKFLATGLLFISAISAVVSTSNEQNPTGFISIDCGSKDAQYKDPRTGLVWLDDSNYTKTGSNGLVSSHVDSSMDNSNALQTFRYFPIHRNKHCYDLKLSTNSTSVLVLIRAMFFRGNASKLTMPIVFDVSINANIWFTAIYDPVEAEDDFMDPIIREGLFHATPFVYVCLLPKQGVPFISSIELRPLDPGGVMYNFKDRDQLYLSTLLRLNTGPPPGAATVRYPDDIYDRLWVNAHADGWTVSSTEFDVPSKTPSLRLNDVPVEVLSDSWDWTNGDYDGATSPNGAVLFYKFFKFSFPEASNKAICLYPIFYFEPGENPRNDVYYVQITINDQPLGQFNVTNTTAQPFQLILPNNQAQFEIFTTSPVLSAVEFYEQVISDPSKTNDRNLQKVNRLKRIYNLEDWQGDPCLPLPYDWLSCKLNVDMSLAISSITLSNLSSGGDLLKLQSGDLYALTGLSLTYSQINDTILDHLLNITQSSSSLQTLNLDHNLITKTEWLLDNSVVLEYLTSLTLSHNLLGGAVPSLVNATFTNTLQQLILSHNGMTNLPPDWGNPPTDFVIKSLTILDLSSNNITSSISRLTAMIERNLHLKELHLSNNLLSGGFPSKLYFSLRDVEIINIDNNLINGILDLTTWRDNLMGILNSSSIPTSTNSSLRNINQVFSFVNNKITGISPSIESLAPIMSFFLQQQDAMISYQSESTNTSPAFNKGGILLGGNPYCKSPQSRSQQYICRSSLDEMIPVQKKNKSNKLPIVLSLGAAPFILCGIVVAVVIWKYWKEIRVLRSIQYALVKQDVQPRFYLYSDIKHATRNFHSDNMLGKGGFGIVFKGKLEDGNANSISIAVKKLFDSAENRVLNEFLNEVVLISGIKHRNLIQLRGCCITEKERMLIYEFAEGGNLEGALWGKGSGEAVMNWDTRYTICVGIARGLAYLHEELQPRIIHRDIKAANILLDKNTDPKIGDFGLAKPILIDVNTTNFTEHIVGTRGYIAPEHAIHGQLTEKSDVYSFGILLLEIISGRKCLDSNLDEDQVYLKTWVEILNEEGRLLSLLERDLQGSCPEDEVLKLINIALICVKSNPKFRPKMSEVITMLVGTVEIGSFLNRHDSADDKFFSQHASSDLSRNSYTLDFQKQASFDEQPESPLLASSSTTIARNSRRFDPSASRNVATLELSKMSGR